MAREGGRCRRVGYATLLHLVTSCCIVSSAISTRPKGDTLLPSHYYRTCDKCGHVETVPSHDDRPYRCENCGSTAGWEFTTLSKAEQHSQDILDRQKVPS